MNAKRKPLPEIDEMPEHQRFILFKMAEMLRDEAHKNGIKEAIKWSLEDIAEELRLKLNKDAKEGRHPSGNLLQ
jgi:hypothetical protein